MIVPNQRYLQAPRKWRYGCAVFAGGMPGRHMKMVLVQILFLATLFPGLVIAQSPAIGPYRVEAGFLEIGSDPEQPEAEIFYTAYTLDDADHDERPVTFAWNGGPGASSAYLHVLALGPRVVEMPGDGSLPAVPARLVENPETWLHFTDLVFIDPVGTGYSRALPKGEEEADPKKFYDADRDLQVLGEVIRLWLTKNARWASPKGIAGESYGGRRVAALSLMLVEDFSISLNWAIMISPALNDDIEDLDAQYGVLGPAVSLPSYAAVTAYHDDIPTETDMLLAEVEAFALGEYVSGLAGLWRADDAEARALYARVAELTGLPVEDVSRLRGRVPLGEFITGPVEDDNLVVNPYDGTQLSVPPLPRDEARYAIESALLTVNTILSAPFLDYARTTLDLDIDRPYEFLNSDVNRAFDRDTRRGGPDDVAQALALNPDLKILVAHGIHDLVTPYFATRYVLGQTVQAGDGADRMSFHNFEGGHMFYLTGPSRTGFFEAARRLYESN